MKRKIINLLMWVMMAAVMLLAACSGGESAKITQLSDLEGKVVAMMSTPQDPKMVQEFLEQQLDVTFKEMQFFETFSAAVAALKSNQVDAVFNSDVTLDFYTAHDESLNSIPITYDIEAPTTAHMAVRADDTELLTQLNDALAAMKEDGTLDRLEREFITDLTPDKQLEGKAMPQFEGAPSLIVGVAGDIPPVDYVAADGSPAGYNVELLSLLGEMLQVNIEISVMPMESKFPALAADRIDMFFLQAANADVELMVKTLAANENAALTVPYYEFYGYDCLVLK